MKFWQRFLSYFIVVAIGFTISFFIFSVVLPPAEGILVNGQSVQPSDSKASIHLVALGDSLTEGVGDTTKQGGYVPLVANEVEDYFHLDNAFYENFGKSGDRSDQILKRLKKSSEQQEALKKADVVTVTVGGNDLMKTVQKELFKNLSLASFEKPATNYQKNLRKLFTEIRKYAPDAPIYVFGIYNPFYVYFSQMTELQDIVNYWNEVSQETVEEGKRSYFIPINDLLSKGTQSLTADAKISTSSSDVRGTIPDSSTNTSLDETSSLPEDVENLIQAAATNDLIFDEDHFHPNNLGYQKMASALKDELIQTQRLWLKKVENK